MRGRQKTCTWAHTLLQGEHGAERERERRERGSGETEERAERKTLALKLEDSKVIDLVGCYSNYSLIYI